MGITGSTPAIGVYYQLQVHPYYWGPSPLCVHPKTHFTLRALQSIWGTHRDQHNLAALQGPQCLRVVCV